MLRQLARSGLRSAPSHSVIRAATSKTGSAAFSTGARLHAPINLREYPPSDGFQLYSEKLEKEIRQRLDALPPPSKLYQNADGTTRNPSDEDLKEAASLTYLARHKRINYGDYFKLTNEQRGLFQENQEDLGEYYSSGERILDKVPVFSKDSGEITWQVIREKQKEGWEELIYYGYIPGALIAMFFALFLDRENISDWAMEELRLRAQEHYNDNDTVPAGKLSPEEAKKRDELIVERIISGEYDRLAGLKKAGQDLPASLI